jgi:hypothetical protein
VDVVLSSTIIVVKTQTARTPTRSGESNPIESREEKFEFSFGMLSDIGTKEVFPLIGF